MKQANFNRAFFDLWRQERLKDLQIEVSALSPSDFDFPFANYMLMRSSAARFDFNKTSEIISAFTETSSRHPWWSEVFRLWSVYLDLIRGARVDIDAVITYFKDQVSKAGEGSFLNAVAQDLLSSIISYGISFGQLPATDKQHAIILAQESVDAYETVCCDYESLNKKKSLIQLYRKKPYEQPEFAVSLAKDLLRESNANGDELLKGHAQLALAEIAFEDAHQAEVTLETLNPIITLFNEAEQSLRTGGYLAAEALVNDRAGQLCLRYGYTDGLRFLEVAIEGYKSAQMLPNVYDCWLQISNWHLHHGNNELYQQVKQAADEIGSRFDISLSSFIAVMDQIESAYRGGRIGQGRDLYQKAIERFQGNHLRNQLDVLQANNLLKVNLAGEAIQIHRENLARYEHLKVSAWLSDAYYNLASQLIVLAPTEAKILLLKAIAIDEELNDRFESIRRIQRYIEATVQEQLKVAKTIQITDEITLSLDQCFLRMKNLRTLQAVQRTGEVLQGKGQVYFFNKQFELAKQLYNDAKRIFISGELNANLGFLYTQESLLFIEEARSWGSLQLFNEALSLLEQAKEVFGKMGYVLELSRFYFLTGVAHYEAARLTPGQEKANKRYAVAESSFEEAYQLLSVQIRNMDLNSGVSRQRSMIAFIEEGVKVFQQAFNMNCFFMYDNWAALKWLDRMKSQALLHSILGKEVETDSSELRQLPDQFLQIRHDPDFYLTVRQNLRPEILVLSYYCTTEKVFVFGIKQSWDSPIMQAFDISHQELTEVRERHFSNRFDGVFGMMRHRTERRWQKFSQLIDPVLSWCEPGELVYLIPHDVLHDLPMHCFICQNGQYLIDRNPIVYQYSISLLLLNSHQTLTSFKPTGTAVFGDSRNNLPFAREEAIKVGELLGVKPYLGSEVTLGKLMSAIEKDRLIHISCHGDVSGKDGFTYGVQLSGDATLTGKDLFEKTSCADLVVLSGCETGSTEQFTGDELMGLVRGFLYAGAGCVIVSQWRVNDEKTAELFASFYTNLSTVSAELKFAVALQRAMVELKRHSYHFFYWGAFKLIGNII